MEKRVSGKKAVLKETQEMIQNSAHIYVFGILERLLFTASGFQDKIPHKISYSRKDFPEILTG